MGKSSTRGRPHGWKAWFCRVMIFGAVSSGASAGAASATVPAAPTITSVTAESRAVTVAFTQPASDGGARISSYRVVCTSPNGGVTGSHQAARSPISVAGLTNAKPYTCSATATNNVGAGHPSTPSAPVVTLPTVPAAPTITAVTAGARAVTVAFTKPANDGGAPVTIYRVVCTASYGVTRSHNAPTSPISVACIEAAETYTCTVAAQNRVGMGPASAPSNPVVSLPTVPGPPTITSATAGLRAVTVAYKKPADDGGARISSYQVMCTSPNGVAGSHQASSSPISVAGLTNAQPYTCTVRATNNVGAGPPSTFSSPVVTLPTAPGPPAITSVNAGLRAVTVAYTTTNNGNAPILSYRVACTSPNGVAGSHDAPASPITVAGLSAAVPYACTVTATNNVGTGLPSTPSNPVFPRSN